MALVHELFPDRKDVTAKNLIKNMGAMNITIPFIGGMPLCHGAGGLSAQYLFGARTDSAILMEGILEICLGMFFSKFGEHFHGVSAFCCWSDAAYDNL